MSIRQAIDSVKITAFKRFEEEDAVLNNDEEASSYLPLSDRGKLQAGSQPIRNQTGQETGQEAPYSPPSQGLPFCTNFNEAIIILFRLSIE
jgi:hypothetical protein